MHTKCWPRSSCIPKQFPNTPPSQFYLNAAFPGPGCSLLPAQALGKEELLPFPSELLLLGRSCSERVTSLAPPALGMGALIS